MWWSYQDVEERKKQVQREIAKGIEQAEALRMQLRAAESGIVIAGNVPSK